VPYTFKSYTIRMKKYSDQISESEATVKALLYMYGKSFAEELDIKLESNTRSSIFQLFIATLLFSIRINTRIALEAARAVFEQGWITPEKLASSTWQSRIGVLDEAKYVRYDESMSRKLGEMAKVVIERYGGDIRRLRETAGRDPARERELLKEFNGIGDVGVDIFFREIQLNWDELYPFIDKRAAIAAKILDLNANALAGFVSRKEFPRLAAALIRVDIFHGYEVVMKRAEQLRAAGRVMAYA